jgi:hypothetical protein
VAAVQDHQLGDGAGGGDFGDGEAPVLEGAVRRGDDRHDDDLRFSKMNRL